MFSSMISSINGASGCTEASYGSNKRAVVKIIVPADHEEVPLAWEEIALNWYNL